MAGFLIFLLDFNDKQFMEKSIQEIKSIEGWISHNSFEFSDVNIVFVFSSETLTLNLRLGDSSPHSSRTTQVYNSTKTESIMYPTS